MLVNLISAIAVSAIVFLLVWAYFRTVKKPMPRALLPILIGGTAISYGIYSEYSWESRTLQQMPASVEVVSTFEGRSVFSPWAYLIPRTDRMSLVDTNTIRRNPEHPDYLILDLLLMQRFSPVMQVRQLVDCQRSQRADLTNDPVFDSEGLPTDLQWETLPEDHRLLEVACATP
ncbi:hypothetical protein [Granulosicoccus antarcticus]|uniref:Uncharacterized protein n=1 Tax=Granulosicoccus antarcticus IMCC3135 TaxID=1192854 RepID=A0A2Z2NNS6_9GAMM|nr:hypothetical protein [Granulosicoccus antarcticus]ASJ73066.1 hypothetical protein IMCC3135_14905 [Granulosicoccus antarcticus IMCC3135]